VRKSHFHCFTSEKSRLSLLDQLLLGLLGLLGADHNVALSFHPAADLISHSCGKEIIKETPQ